MSEPIKDGGPAFPYVWHEDDGYGHQIEYSEMGMMLRDWFAGQALAGLISHPEDEGHVQGFADKAYAFADAMIAAREAKTDEASR